MWQTVILVFHVVFLRLETFFDLHFGARDGGMTAESDSSSPPEKTSGDVTAAWKLSFVPEHQGCCRVPWGSPAKRTEASAQ